MCAAVSNDLAKKKLKTKSVLGFCNNFLTKMVPVHSKSSLKTDAVPMDNNNDLQRHQVMVCSESHQSTRQSGEVNGQITSPGFSNAGPVVPMNTSISEQNASLEQHRAPMQLIQNNLSPTNQNLTVIESQQNLHFNNINGLQIGNTYHMSGNNSRKNSSNGICDDKPKRKKTKSIMELMNSTDEIDPQIMRIAARFIGENWRMVFRDLSISNAEIAQIKEQYFHINLAEVIYQLLLRWERNSDDPSIGRLSRVLWQTKNDECILELKKYYKNLKRLQVGMSSD